MPITDDLWAAYWDGRSIANRNRLIERYLPVVEIAAGKIRRRLPACVESDEIRSAGYFGLIRAVESFDSTRSIKFETYLFWRVTVAVNDWLREIDPQSRTVRSFEKKRRTANDSLDSRLHRPATDAELADGLDITLDRYQHLSELSRRGHKTSSISHANEQRCECLRSRCQDPSERISRRSAVTELLGGLTQREQMILKLKHVEELTFTEIGRATDLSPSRVSEIHSAAVERLRKAVAS